MNNHFKPYLCPYYYDNTYFYNPYGYSYPQWVGPQISLPNYPKQIIKLKDYGPDPFVVDIEEATLQNNTFRTALWTGKYLQLTLMSIDVGGEIGLEIHPDHDQFLRVEQGQGLVLMGDHKDKLHFKKHIFDNYAVFVPAGKWHNIINTGHIPLKLYSIYAPPEHPHGTVHKSME